MTKGLTRACRRARRARVGCVLLMMALTAAACTSAPSAPATAIPVTDFRMVAGHWSGVVVGLAGPKNDEGDWVDLTIAEDGTYDFGVYRTIGVFAGKGKLTLVDGKLASEGERGRATFTLSERGGRQYLRAEGVQRSGTSISGDLHRKQ
jgi:hypothetical protein